MAGVNRLADCNPAAAPRLSAALGANKTVRFAWPAGATGFTLQETSTINPAKWTAVTTAPVVQGNENVVTIMIAATRFYRLAK